MVLWSWQLIWRIPMDVLHYTNLPGFGDANHTISIAVFSSGLLLCFVFQPLSLGPKIRWKSSSYLKITIWGSWKSARSMVLSPTDGALQLARIVCSLIKGILKWKEEWFFVVSDGPPTYQGLNIIGHNSSCNYKICPNHILLIHCSFHVKFNDLGLALKVNSSRLWEHDCFINSDVVWSWNFSFSHRLNEP